MKGLIESITLLVNAIKGCTPLQCVTLLGIALVVLLAMFAAPS